MKNQCAPCGLVILLGVKPTMKNCSYCGRDNIKEALNCRECGTEFEQFSEPLPSEELKPVVTSNPGLPSGMETDDKPILKYDNILVSSRGKAETHAKKVVIFVPAVEIDRITLKYGRSDHRPILTMSIGTALTLFGVFGLIELAEAPRGIRYELGMGAFGLVGGSMIFDTLKRRLFFEVQKRKACADWFSQRMHK
jgi:predicted RNA-binding Zn-ribbon protein involved in translation (DUF1610 family)